MGFVAIYHAGLDRTVEVPESTAEVLAASGWRDASPDGPEGPSDTGLEPDTPVPAATEKE